MILSIDGGSENVKAAGENIIDIFPSVIGEYRDRKKKDKHGSSDMEFEINGKRGFAGSLAIVESVFTSTIRGETKAHHYLKIRVLLALHRNCNERNVKIVAGQPISMHTDTEKNKIIVMLKGEHKITVNGVTKEFFIEECVVGLEGAAAYLCIQRPGKIRIIDIGGGTVNLATILNGSFVDKESRTLPFGFNSSADKSKGEHIIQATYNEAYNLGWRSDDEVYFVGGPAETLISKVINYFSNTQVIAPLLDGEMLEPVFGTAVGLLLIGRAVYAKDGQENSGV
ncbi:ParM/StbA family protein [Priestia taiwanensis]|uniref:Actin-like protein N-terminal domain-containing protein n=1 Tax=Priestia taiwanensis TaxID=1347902 RepID=A0A917AMN5_9BACI|nr:ParM/StbA family protein [Priestia taiwanensis]MBM7362422.1 plasmid segregation protein ParM [Priestia taiwanensis]GGE62109.1 hypothetical protein GCM10007140_10460 [Priestia taiwanensis]